MVNKNLLKASRAALKVSQAMTELVEAYEDDDEVKKLCDAAATSLGISMQLDALAYEWLIFGGKFNDAMIKKVEDNQKAQTIRIAFG